MWYIHICAHTLPGAQVAWKLFENVGILISPSFSPRIFVSYLFWYLYIKIYLYYLYLYIQIYLCNGSGIYLNIVLFLYSPLLRSAITCFLLTFKQFKQHLRPLKQITYDKPLFFLKRLKCGLFVHCFRSVSDPIFCG